VKTLNSPASFSLRRREAGQANAQRDVEKGRCRFGGWQLDRRNRRLANSTGELVALTIRIGCSKPTARVRTADFRRTFFYSAAQNA
jgi:hypothetical protein